MPTVAGIRLFTSAYFPEMKHVIICPLQYAPLRSNYRTNADSINLNGTNSGLNVVHVYLLNKTPSVLPWSLCTAWLNAELRDNELAAKIAQRERPSDAGGKQRSATVNNTLAEFVLENENWDMAQMRMGPGMRASYGVHRIRYTRIMSSLWIWKIH